MINKYLIKEIVAYESDRSWYVFAESYEQAVDLCVKQGANKIDLEYPTVLKHDIKGTKEIKVIKVTEKNYFG